MLTEEVRNLAERSVLCWLATVDESGQPNVSPKEIFSIIDDKRVIIGHIASPVSARNINLNSKVCLSFVDIFSQRGYKIYGNASYIPAGSQTFLDMAAPLLAMAGDRFPLYGLLVIEANKCFALNAPSYTFYPETTEQQMRNQAMLTYGVHPVSKRKPIA